MVNPYQPPESATPPKAPEYRLLKRILAVPLAGVSLVSALLAVAVIAGTAVAAFAGDGTVRLGGLIVYLGVVIAVSLGSFALARAFWDPDRYSRKSLDQAELRAIYARERLAEMPNGETGMYRETQDGELGRLYARVRPDRLPQRHRELMARIKERVEELGPAQS